MREKKRLTIYVYALIILFLLILGNTLSYSTSWGRKIVFFDEVLYPEKKEFCENIYVNLTLKSFNGIEDIDTGILSGGNVYRTNLLFTNGLILKFGRRDKIDTLILGRNYTYRKCYKSGGFLNMNSGTDINLILENE